MPRDNTQYRFNEKVYGKGPLVLAVIKKYIADREPTFSELVDKFSEENISVKQCVIGRKQYEDKLVVSDDVTKRYFKDNEQLVTKDGVEVLVNSQWGISNINSFITYVNDIGYSLLAEIDGETIISLFEKYKANPRKDWISRYQKHCTLVQESSGIEVVGYDGNFIQDLWKTNDNGIANVAPGFLSHDEYEKLSHELPEITKQILDNPTSETLDSVYKWAEKAKLEGKFKSIKKGVIHRVFAAADPQKITTLLSETKHLNKLINVLNKRYAFNISSSGNWIKKNIELKKALKDAGVEDEDPTIVNTFIWKLYEDLVQKFEENQEQPIAKDDIYEQEVEVNDFPLEPAKNTILYGPPGTGKTYQLQQLTQEKYTSKDVLQDDSLWQNQQLSKLSWFEVVILILLDLGGENSVTNIIEHKYFQTKADMNDRTSNIRQTAWAALQAHAISDSITVKYDKRTEPLVFNKTENSLWFIVDDNDDQFTEYKTQLELLKEGPKQPETVNRFEFVTFHQSYSYEEFVEGLRPVTNDKGDISYIVEPGVFKRLCKRAETDPNNRYAMVIDEINRGNISKILGELISLIEIDKRTGSDNELTVTLPYSKLPFSVPANIDIIGSMNTADRSLTPIDVALRRRFEFEELRTHYSLLPINVDDVNIKRMLFAMNQRIELLLDRDHIIGHALLMKVSSIDELGKQFKTAILPLLEEYFFDDWGRIDQVFNGNGIVEENKRARSIWLGSADEYAPKTYSINSNALSDVNTYQKIYEDIDDETFAECGLVGS